MAGDYAVAQPKSCIRFKQLEDVPLDVIGQTIARMPVQNYIAYIEKVLAATARKNMIP